jgi:hypothetical protein
MVLSIQTPKPEISSHYHKSGDFQDNTANREFFGPTEDWAFRSWGISEVRFLRCYGIILDLAILEIIFCNRNTGIRNWERGIFFEDKKFPSERNLE